MASIRKAPTSVQSRMIPMMARGTWLLSAASCWSATAMVSITDRERSM